MRQGAEDLFHWNCSADAAINYQPNSPPMDSNIDKMNPPKIIMYQSSSESGIYSDLSTPSPDSDIDNYQDNSNKSEYNFSTLRIDTSTSRRKISESSDTSSLIDSSSSVCSSQHDNNSTIIQDDNPLIVSKFDDIIEKIVELKFTPNNLNDKGNKELNINDNDNYKEKDVDVGDNVMEKEKKLKEKVVVKKMVLEEEEDNEEVVENSHDQANDNEYDDDDDDDDLKARGPVKPQPSQSRNKPYHTLNDWLESSAGMQPYTSDIDSTAQQILSNQQFSDMLNPCLDRLEDYNKRQSHCSSNISNNGWITMTNQDTTSALNNLEDTISSIPSIPSITVSENSLSGEALLMEILDQKGFQGAQSDIASNANPSPAASSENWPDSPNSITSYNVLSSRSHSRASSRAQSPGSSTNIGSPHVPANIIGSPPDISQGLHRIRARTAMSSSSSSNYSFSDTQSPSNYHQTVDPRIEDHLGIQFGNFSTWCDSCESSGTIVDNNENTTDDIDNSLKLLEEVIKDDLEYEEMQVVPKYLSQENNSTALWRYRMRNRILSRQQNEADNHNNKTNSSSPSSKSTSSSSSSSSLSSNQMPISNLGNTASIISSAQINLVYPEYNGVYGTSSFEDNVSQQNDFNQKSFSSAENTMTIENELMNLLSTNYPQNNIGNDQFYTNEQQQQQQQVTPTNTMNLGTSSHHNFLPQAHESPQIHLTKHHQPSTSNNQPQFYNNPWCEQPPQQHQHHQHQPQLEQQHTTFNDFQVPKPVSQFRLSHSKRNSDRNVAPWSSLNLPLTPATRRLKNELNSKEVEQAMKNLLKKSTEELAMADEDGDTMLMCLVGNPAELQKKKAYLIPLVERLGISSDGLSKINNRGEDALYLAAMNCPEMPYVTGYLGAVMVQRGIDMSQRLYQTRGDTLIHAVAANGDTHLAVLAELLALKTRQGNAMFDLSTCNYDGRTPLHVAVEAHDPSGLRINSIGIIRLLLENGADSKIKEIRAGNTALHLAVSLSCDPVLVKTLLAGNGHEAVNIPNRNNNTSLHMAAAMSDSIPLDKQIEVCMHLIRAGGLTNIQNHQGKMPLALVSIERKECIKNIFRGKF